jgi:hypothetical protein
MDEDGGNVTQIAPMNIGSVLHPTPLRDGRLTTVALLVRTTSARRA